MNIRVPAIIPIPQKIKSRERAFTLDARTRIVVDADSRETGEYLADRLRKATGYPFAISNRTATGGILLTTDAAKVSHGPEGYQLEVGENSIVIRAPEPAGLFYGVQSLFQLLPPEIFAPAPVSNVDWKIACVSIEDRPRFNWRGFMLDVSRHFFNKDEVKQLLDAMALHKLNTFHWHLVDDQGWRVEIKKYPDLTEIGAWRDGIGFGLDPTSSSAYRADGKYGGFYTQEDISEVVAYAQSRHITIVPEIEMPGHSTAALSAYPELSCPGTQHTIQLVAGVFHGVYCAGNDNAFTFLEDVLTEVIPLFRGKYIHVGGDEVPTDNWKKCPKCQKRIKDEGLGSVGELEGYFINRIEKFVRSQGRILVGWSEIFNEGLAQNAALMDWIDCAVKAASAGHDVVMSPEKECYLDRYQSMNHSTEPVASSHPTKPQDHFLPVNRAYSLEPVPADLPCQLAAHILGPQGCLWTEYVASLGHVEFMAFPRMSALAEVGWSTKSSRDWDDFSRRLQVHYKRLDQLGITYRHYPYNLPAWPSPVNGDAKPAAL